MEKNDYKYNNAGDLEKVDYQDKETPDVVYQYDRLGRRIETTQGKDYVQQMTYDSETWRYSDSEFAGL